MAAEVLGTLDHPVVAAVTDATEVLDEAAEAALWSLSASELRDLLASTQGLLARVHAERARLVHAVDTAPGGVPAGGVSTQAWLRGALHLAPDEASQTVRVARALHGSDAMTATATALAAGQLSWSQAAVITRAVDALPAKADAEVRHAAEQLLVQAAATLDPVPLARAGRVILDHVAPDLADEPLAAQLAKEEAKERRARELKTYDNGTGRTWWSGHLDAEGQALVAAALDPLAAPRKATPEGPDPRTAVQRRADALVELCRRHLDGGTLPAQRSVLPHIIVTVPLATLTERLGSALLPDGTALSPETARRLACDAQLIPTVLGAKGELLDLGRRTRLFTGPLRKALIARDQGCVHPWCDRPPAWTDGHHLWHWADGGPTELSNGVLLCHPHHVLAHQGQWQVRLGRDALPEWIPPAWHDPEQRPLRHHRFDRPRR